MDLAKNDNSKWERSKTGIRKSTVPQPKRERAKPTQASCCNGGVESKNKKSKTDISGSSLTALRTGRVGSKLTKSYIEIRSPVQARPKNGSKGPGRMDECNGMDESDVEESITDREKSSRARLRSRANGPVIMQSNASTNEPRFVRPKRKTTNPSHAKDRKDMERPN